MKNLREEVCHFLKSHQILLKKSLGQHFLVDPGVLDIIVKTADIHPDDHIVEIGPGIGILTRALLKNTQHVIAIELDQNLIPLLKEFVSDFARPDECPFGRGFRISDFDIVHANALSISFPTTPYKIVANIPYHITSSLLRHAFVESTPPLSLTLLIQKEVAEKICDTTNASRLTVLVGLFGTPKIIANVPPSAFLPPPKVDSAVLHITVCSLPKAKPQVIERVFELTHKAFGQKRKMLRNTIDPKLLESASIDPMRRPQTLTIDEWIALAEQET